MVKHLSFILSCFLNTRMLILSQSGHANDGLWHLFSAQVEHVFACSAAESALTKVLPKWDRRGRSLP